MAIAKWVQRDIPQAIHSINPQTKLYKLGTSEQRLRHYTQRHTYVKFAQNIGDISKDQLPTHGSTQIHPPPQVILEKNLKVSRFLVTTDSLQKSRTLLFYKVESDQASNFIRDFLDFSLEGPGGGAYLAIDCLIS